MVVCLIYSLDWDFKSSLAFPIIVAVIALTAQTSKRPNVGITSTDKYSNFAYAVEYWGNDQSLGL